MSNATDRDVILQSRTKTVCLGLILESVGVVVLAAKPSPDIRLRKGGRGRSGGKRYLPKYVQENICSLVLEAVAAVVPVVKLSIRAR